MRKYLVISLLLSFLSVIGYGQVGSNYPKYYHMGSLSVGKGITNASNPAAYAHSSVHLEIGSDSTNKALGLPRVVDTSLITGQVKGDMIFQIIDRTTRVYTGSYWQNLGGSSGGGVDSTTPGLWLTESANQLNVDTSLAAAYLLRRKDSLVYLTPSDAAAAYQPAGSYLTSEVDGSTTNELQTIAKVSSTVTLSAGGGSFTDDTGTIQNLSINGRLLSITGGSTITLPDTVTPVQVTNWNAAYNDKINSAAFTGSGTKTLTLTQQDAGTVTANFTDDNTTYTNGYGVNLAGTTFSVDSATLSTYYIRRKDSSTSYVTPKRLSDTAAAIRAAFPTGVGTGDVVGPVLSTDNAIARFDLLTGKLIQNSNLIINDNGGLQFPPVQNSISYALGQIAFDTTCDCYIIDGKTSATRLNVGQELWENVFNNTPSTITSGQAVYITGGVTIAGEVFATVGLAQANSSSTIVCIGLATEDIAVGARGKVTTNGTVHGLNTSGLSVGNVFVSSATPGGLTNTAPAAPNYRYRVGVVSTVDATVGTIKVTGSTGALGNGTANQVFGMNAAGTAQEVKSITAANGASVTNAANSITIGTPFRMYRYKVDNVNLLATGNSTIVTTDANKGRFIITTYHVHISTYTAASGSITFNIGTTPANYLDNVATVSLNLGSQINAVGKYSTANPVTTLSVPPSTALVFRITSAGTGTACTATVYVVGFYENE